MRKSTRKARKACFFGTETYATTGSANLVSGRAFRNFRIGRFAYMVQWCNTLSPNSMDALHQLQAIVQQNTSLVAIVCVVAVLAFIGYLVMISGAKPSSSKGDKTFPTETVCLFCFTPPFLPFAPYSFI